MTHLNEGTIHAWLDGALSATEAHEAQSHVGGCAECSARVAEARGLIAGASRILTALDDVPAGVTPKRAPSTAPPTRQWRAAPWVTGIAATLMLAIGIRAYTREPAAAVAERSVVVFDSVAPALATQATPAAPPTERVSSVAAPAAHPTAQATSVAAYAAPVQRPPALGDQALRRDAALGAAGAVGAVGGAGAVTREAREKAQTTALSSAGAGASAELGSLRMAKRAARAEASSDAKKPAEEQVPTAAPMAFKSELGVGAYTKDRDERELAGCYPIERPARGRLVDDDAAAARKVAASPSPRTFRMDEASSKAPPGLPAMVLLDTTRNSQGGLVARAAATREAVGAWNRIDGDSVRVDLLVRGLYTIAASKRVGCPAP